MGYRVYKTGTIVLNFITQRLNSFNFDAGLRNGKVIHHKMIHFSFSAKDSISSIIAEADTRSLGFFLMQRAISFLATVLLTIETSSSLSSDFLRFNRFFIGSNISRSTTP
mmetsp:Transcript_16416/g.19707  ORF Transcript_16416/g.19707 Transcript_16416/m.19707 type:complete len:110 (+) Transcript_16416:156-485(+)